MTIKSQTEETEPVDKPTAIDLVKALGAKHGEQPAVTREVDGSIHLTLRVDGFAYVALGDTLLGASQAMLDLLEPPKGELQDAANTAANAEHYRLVTLAEENDVILAREDTDEEIREKLRAHDVDPSYDNPHLSDEDRAAVQNETTRDTGTEPTPEPTEED